MSKLILVTAGNTSEPIDSVRTITNTATGTLGSMIADYFMDNGVEVVYVCGQGAVQPKHSTVETRTIVGVHDLKQVVEDLSNKYSFDCIVHSMAVSDYTVKGVLAYDDMKKHILEGKSLDSYTTTGKLSSDMANPIIMLENAPKIISYFKTLQPKALLVGFKLLVGVTEEKLYQTALNLMNKNNCDFVCANDLDHISKTEHVALIISKDGSYTKMNTKAEIAESIVKAILNKWREQV